MFFYYSGSRICSPLSCQTSVFSIIKTKKGLKEYEERASDRNREDKGNSAGTLFGYNDRLLNGTLLRAEVNKNEDKNEEVRLSL